MNNDYQLIGERAATWINEAGLPVDGHIYTFEWGDNRRFEIRATEQDLISGALHERVRQHISAVKALEGSS